MLLTIVSFLLILTVLVLIHEAGHFFTAKLFGVKVEEFGFGFPPRAWGKKIGETLYSINWLPIGGFVKLFGEDEAGGGKVGISSSKSPSTSFGSPQDKSFGFAQDKSSGTSDLHRAFFARPVWQRFLIVFAGVFMNFVLATLLLTYLVGVQGIPAPGNKIFVTAVVKNSPAQHAGLVPGDRIVKVDGNAVSSTNYIISYTKAHEGKQITLTIETKEKKLEKVLLTPRVHFPANEGAMGVAIETNVVAKHFPWYLWPLEGLKMAILQSWLILTGLWGLLTQLTTQGKVPQDLAGPIGIAQITGQFVQMGFTATLSLLALLSLNLAILNVLPIPALDGGRLFFIVIEGITRRKVSPKIEGYVHTAGMVFLLILIALITLHDIIRIATGGSLLPH